MACDCTPFVQRYADLTAKRTGRAVQSHNLGVAGLTSDGLLSMLSDGSDTADSVSAADIDLVTIGANDVAEAMQEWSNGTCGQSCLDADTAGVRTRVVAVVNRILALRAGRPTEILVTTYWNVVQDGAIARQSFSAQYQQVSDGLTREVNTALRDAVQAAQPTTGPGGLDTVLCVDLYAPFKGDGGADPTTLLAPDGDHPSDAGHQLIATTLAGVGWAALEG
jgi:lysophospholipase L1-like esterase